MKTLSQLLNEECSTIHYFINEAFSSSVIANLHKNNPEVMNQFFRSLAKYRYSVNGLKDDFVTETNVSQALKKRTNDIVKFWMIGPKVAAISCGNGLVDENFNWVSKGAGARNNDTLIGDKEAIQNWLSKGDSYAKSTFTTCFMIVVSSLKALGEKKQPTEIVTKDEEIIKYKPNLLEVPKLTTKKKPSDLKKLRDTSKTVDVLFKSGDIYDTHDSGYTDKFTYYSGEGDGYIMDKNGMVYDVICKSYSGDAGRIAGGSMNWSCTIKRIDGTNDIYFSGYHGVFSSPSSPTAEQIVSDIRGGMFLEDYLAKHWRDTRSENRDKFKDIMEKGDPNAKTFQEQKENIASIKKENFYLTYILLPKQIPFTITSSGIELHNVLQNDKELKNLNKAEYGSPTYEQDKKAYLDVVERKTEIVVNGIIKPIITKILGSIFKTGSITSYAGISGVLFTEDINSYKESFALDTTSNKIVVIDTEQSKVVKTSVTFRIDDTLTTTKDKCSPKTLEVFKNASNEFLKLNKNKQTEYVNKNWEKIYNNSYKPYRGYELTKGQARARSKEEYMNWINKHDFSKNNRLSLSWNLIQNYINDELGETSKQTVEPLPEPATFKQILPKSVVAEADAKMDAWHAGTRKQNVGAMSDAKLKMNYEICKNKGYEKEMNILKTEANKRNLLLECLGLNECLQIL